MYALEKNRVAVLICAFIITKLFLNTSENIPIGQVGRDLVCRDTFCFVIWLFCRLILDILDEISVKLSEVAKDYLIVKHLSWSYQ